MWKQAQVHVALFVVNLIYAGNYTIAKTIMPSYIGPFGFIVMRVTVAWMLYTIVVELLVEKRVERKDLLHLAACGLFGVAANQLMFFKGLSITTPINASLIMITAPILVMIMSSFILKERITLVKSLGILLGAVGAFLVILGKDFNFNSETWLGDLFVLLNAASYAIYLVIVKPLMKKYPPLLVIKWVFFFGMFPVLAFGWKQFSVIEWSTFGLPEFLALAYVVIMTTFVAYLLNMFALSKADPSLVGIYIYLQPILATAIAMIFRGDELTYIKILAGILIFIGVYLVGLRPKITTERA